MVECGTYVKVEIDKDVRDKFLIDFDSEIQRLLRVIPDEHLANLEKIRVIYISPFKGSLKTSQGFYVPGSNKNRPYIILCTKNIFKGFSNLFLKIFPSFVTSFLADVLYHEIGHHYQKISHGYKNQIKEKHAERYSSHMKAQYFYSKGFGKMAYKLKVFLSNRKVTTQVFEKAKRTSGRTSGDV